MQVICNEADLIAAKLSPYFFFVFWTAEYAKKRQGAAALFVPKEKKSRSSLLLSSIQHLLSSPVQVVAGQKSMQIGRGGVG